MNKQCGFYKNKSVKRCAKMLNGRFIEDISYLCIDIAATEEEAEYRSCNAYFRICTVPALSYAIHLDMEDV